MAEPNTVTVFQGVRGTGNINANSLIRDVKRAVKMLEADRVKLIIVLEKIGSASTGNPKFEWQEDEYVAENLAINNTAGYNATATSLVFDNTLMAIAGDVLYNVRTAEVMQVTANTTGTSTLTVVRDAASGRVTGSAINDNDVCVVIGNVNEEGATLRTIVSTQMSFPFNYTQIFRHPVGLTNTEANSDLYNGKDMPYQRRKKLVEHLQEIEKMIYFGKRGEITSGTHPLRFSGGMREFISTNVTADANGTLTQAEWDTFLEGPFRFGSKSKAIVCSNTYILAINKWSKDVLRINQEARKFGLKIWTYVTPWGDAMLFNSEILNRTSTWNGYAFVFDLANMRKRHLQNRNTKLLMDRQANDEDSKKDEYLTEAGLERSFEKAHGLMTGVTAYS